MGYARMRDDLFEELVESIRESGAIRARRRMMLKTIELCEGCEKEYYEAFRTDDDVLLCASCYIEVIKSDNAALLELKAMHSNLREIHKGWRRKLQKQVEGLLKFLSTTLWEEIDDTVNDMNKARHLHDVIENVLDAFKAKP